MASELLLLCGPTRTGKTEAVVDRFCTHADRHGDDAVALIVPTMRAAHRITSRILEKTDNSALYDPRIFTFPTLAETLLDANHVPVSKMSPLQQRLLVEDVVGQLAETGQLPYLQQVVNMTGFVTAVVNLIDELKRAALQPAEFARIAAEKLPDHPLNDDIAAIYQQYQTTVKQRRLYDAAGAFWQARDVLADANRRPLEQVSLLLLDGFTDFTTTQLQMLRLLCADIPRTIVTLCIEQDRRRQLFARTRRTKARMRRHLKDICDITEKWLQPDDSGAELMLLTESIFDEDITEQLDAQGAVQLFSAPGAVAEIRLMARRIKSLIIDRGVAPDEIAVILRSADTYAPLIRDVFDEYDIPRKLSDGRVLARVPIVQAVLDILDVVSGDFRRKDVVRLLKNNYVDIDALQASQQQKITADQFQVIARRAQVIEGRETFERRLNTFIERLQSPSDSPPKQSVDDEEDHDSELHRARASGELFASLCDVLDPLARVQAMPAAAAAIGCAIEQLRINDITPDDATDIAEIAIDRSALRTLFDQLQQLGGAPEAIGVGPERSNSRLIHTITELCQRTRISPRDNAVDGVNVLNVREIAQLRYRHVFVPGLVESYFPRARPPQSFYDDVARRKLSEHRAVLRPRSVRRQQERLFFYTAVSAATDHLWLSFPTNDAEGRPVLPSQYIESVRQLYTEPPQHHTTSLSRVTLPPDEVCCPRELLETVMQIIWHGQQQSATDAPQKKIAATDPAVNAVEALRQVDIDIFEHSCNMAAIETKRQLPAPPQAFDGVIHNPLARAYLAGKFGEKHEFSASQFGEYGSCPMVFFFRRVLTLEAIEDPVEEIEPIQKGRLLHEALKRFFAQRQYGTDNWTPLTDDELHAEAQRMDRHLQNIFASRVRNGRVTHNRLWQLAVEDMADDLKQLLQYEVEHTNSDKKPTRRVWATEMPFGQDGSVQLPIDDANSVRIYGRIDRVDVITGDNASVWRFVILDYKTGSGPSRTTIDRGTNLQLPLYCMAVMRNEFDGHDAEPHILAFYQVSGTPKFRKNIAADSDAFSISHAVRVAQGHIGRYVRAMRNGWFPPLPEDSPCRYCDFSNICRYEQHRLDRKITAASAAELTKELFDD